MKKVLMIIPYFLLWVIYFLMTLDDRNKYEISKAKGMNCVGHKMVSPFTEEYTFDKNQIPQKNYTTWKEFWTNKGY